MVERPAGGVKKGAIKCIFVLFPLASGGLVCCQSPQETKGGEGPPAWLRAPWHPSAQGKLKQVLQKVGSQRAQLRCVMRVFPVVNLVRLTQRVAHTNSTTTPRTNPWSRLSSVHWQLYCDEFGWKCRMCNAMLCFQCYLFSKIQKKFKEDLSRSSSVFKRQCLLEKKSKQHGETLSVTLFEAPRLSL